MSDVKPFLSIDDQSKLLIDRKLSVQAEQEEKMKCFLLNNNYYRVSGYSLTLRKDDIFSESASFDILAQIYEADRRMRHIILSVSEAIEVRIKSMVAYYHSEKYGPLGYMDINNFCCSASGKVNMTNINDYLNVTRKADLQKKSMTESEQFLKYHRDKKGDTLPFWVYVEVLTFSDISKLYVLLDDVIQKRIAIQLGFKSNKSHQVVKNLLHCCTILRNICAHGGRLYNRLFIRKPWLSGREKSILRIENGQPVLDKLFSYILVQKSLTSEHDIKMIRDHIHQIADQYPLVDFKHYGFPDDWKDIL